MNSLSTQPTTKFFIVGSSFEYGFSSSYFKQLVVSPSLVVLRLQLLETLLEENPKNLIMLEDVDGFEESSSLAPLSSSLLT